MALQPEQMGTMAKIVKVGGVGGWGVKMIQMTAICNARDVITALLKI